MNARFRITDPQVSFVRAHRDGAEEPHVHWYVGYAPDLTEDRDARVVLATVHAAGANGGGDVEVSALLWRTTDEPWDVEELASDLEISDAVETLYDFARVSLRSVLALTEADVTVPTKAPAPVIRELVKREDADADA